VTIGPEERSLNNINTEDAIGIQSSTNAEQGDSKDLSKNNFFSPIINNGNGTTVNYNIQSLFAFFRPVLNAWSVSVGATSTFFNTITLTHTTIKNVKETTSTTTLLINTCNDLAIMNSIIHEHVPKCPKPDNTPSESATGGTIMTTDGTSTMSQTTTSTDQTTPVSTNRSSTGSLSSTSLPTTSEGPITSPKPTTFPSTTPVVTIEPPISQPYLPQLKLSLKLSNLRPQ